MLGRNKHSFIELREALVKMDETIMTPQTVKRFLDYIPTPQEIQLLGPYSGKSDKLAKADCFFLEMSKIDHYEERLLGLNLKFNAEERLRDIEVDVKTVFTAALTIRKSQKFAKLLGLILMMGNYMNGSGHKGGAYGFGISSLNRVINEICRPANRYLLEDIADRHKDLNRPIESVASCLCHCFAEGPRHSQICEGV